MNADFQDFKYKDLSNRIIEIFFKVYNKLGYGFLEKVYENAMMKEFKIGKLIESICVNQRKSAS